MTKILRIYSLNNLQMCHIAMLTIVIILHITSLVVRLPSRVQLFCHPMDWSTPGLSVPHHLLKFVQIHVVSIASMMPSSHLILWHLLLLPSIFHNIRDFSNELGVPIRWQKYLSFSFSTSASNEYSELISLKIDWFHILAVQGPPKQLPTISERHIYLYVSVFKLNSHFH